ncbi:OmpP1/FadL family transporter [Thiohalobacter sp.]|uniref:OmpP1/FadL family transporter n=1 Tax=Thiohalobacter sp. TaxID=2025948 RepID=UPI00262807CB|nr:outer membrane protein transport protein [Thiohalobacter sp.]
MNVTFKGSVVAAAVAAVLAAPAVHATNGYFKIGYGTKNRGMAGAGIAFSQDAMASAINPAGIAQVGNRMDVGVELFSPLRDARLDATRMGGADTGKVDSAATVFAIPHAGFAFNMGNMTVGLSIAANGGMNTRYNSNIYTNAMGPAIPAFAGMIGGIAPAVAAGLAADPDAQPYSTLGVNLAQVIIAPTVATQLNQNHTVGASLLIGHQRFRAYGLGLFKGLSTDGANVTNQGDDEAWGAGIRVGWTGKISNNITLGAQASSKIYMQEFDQYRGLFAEQGDFDIPAQFGVGLAIQVNPKTTVALDVQRILYSGVASIANDGPTADQFFGALASVLGTGANYSGAGALGGNDGWGFGWDDITVVKLGVDYQYNNQWTFRGGLNVGGNPIDSDQNLFNILAPGVVKRHLTLGFTYSPSAYNELSVTYMHAFREDQSHAFTATSGGFAGFGYDASIGMDQNALELSYAWKF